MKRFIGCAVLLASAVPAVAMDPDVLFGDPKRYVGARVATLCQLHRVHPELSTCTLMEPGGRPSRIILLPDALPDDVYQRADNCTRTTYKSQRCRVLLSGRVEVWNRNVAFRDVIIRWIVN